MTVGERADFTDEGYRLFANLKVTSEVTETGDQIELQLDETNFSSLTLEEGTKLSFTGGGVVIVTNEVTINNSSNTIVQVEFAEESTTSEINSGATTSTPVDLTSTLSIVDDDIAGITISEDTNGSTPINTPITTSEDGSTETFYISLDTKPTDNVAVYVGVENTQDG